MKQELQKAGQAYWDNLYAGTDMMNPQTTIDTFVAGGVWVAKKVREKIEEILSKNMDIFDTPELVSILLAVEHVFTELKESEDERIRKYLIEKLKVAKSVGELKFAIPQPTREECISYLERQKEQKPNVEICPHSIKSKSYRDNGVPTEPISDELVDIIKGVFEGFRRLLKKKGIDYEPQYGYWEGFARLFDSSAREYVKGQKEQKPERINVTEMVAKYRATDEYVEGEYKGKPVNCMIRAYEKGIRDTLSKVKEQKPAVSREEILHQLFQNGSITLSDYLYLTEKQKSAWNEEDEAIVKFYEDDCNHRIGNMPMKDVIEMRLKFKNWITNRIKYLRPQSHWKPSDEQIGTLERICSNLHLRASDDAPKLDEIIEQLKKLM